MESGHGISKIKAQAPLSAMFGYATSLRNCTRGLGSFVMEFHSYEDVPPEIQAVVVGY
jgi:elongation factor G